MCWVTYRHRPFTDYKVSQTIPQPLIPNCFHKAIVALLIRKAAEIYRERLLANVQRQKVSKVIQLQQYHVIRRYILFFLDQLKTY